MPTPSRTGMAGTAVPVTKLAQLDPASVSRFFQALRRQGYAVVELPPETSAAVRAAHKAVAEFFDKNSLDSKNQYNLDKQGFRYGYWPAAHMGKELFQVRLTDSKAKWPSDSFRSTCVECFDSLQAAGEACLLAIGTHLYSGAGKPAQGAIATTNAKWKAYWSSLCKGCTPTDNPHASSLLDLFRYYKATTSSCSSCEMHVDYGLLTLVPRATGLAGLEVYNWERGCWDKAEKDLATNECVVFAGESLSRIAGGRFAALPHRVIVPPKASGGPSTRISSPFLLFANPKRVLRSVEGLPKSRPAHPSPEPVQSEFFVKSMVTKNRSITFGRKWNEHAAASGAQTEGKSAGNETKDVDVDA